MSRPTVRLAVAAALVALLGALAACSSSAEEKKDTSHPEWDGITITIGDNGGDGTEELAKVTGIFDDAPYDVKFARFDFGPPLVAAATAGDLDIGWVGNVPPITGAAKKLGFRVVATTRSLNPDEAVENIIVPKGSAIKTLKDLKGKKLAIPQGSSAHGLALSALKSVGLTPDDVEFVFLSPADGQSAFSSGKVDAWSIWNPQSALAVKDGARIIAKGLPPIDTTNAYYVASEKSLKDEVRRAVIADALKRLGDLFKWGNDHPKEFAEAISKETGISVEEATEILSVFQHRLTAVSEEDIAAQQTLADNFFDAGEIPKKVDFREVVDNLLPEGYDVG